MRAAGASRNAPSALTESSCGDERWLNNSLYRLTRKNKTQRRGCAGAQGVATGCRSPNSAKKAKRRGGYNTQCKKCDKAQVNGYKRTPEGKAAVRRRNQRNYRRYAEARIVYHTADNRAKPWKRLLSSALRRAEANEIAYELTFAWAQARWTGRCELTGLDFKSGLGPGPHAFSASIDRIDPKQGYTQANCRFILAGVNSLKSDGTDAEMFLIATRLAAARPSENVMAPAEAPLVPLAA